MNRRFLLAGVVPLALLAGLSTARAAYVLNGQPSSAGAYAYADEYAAAPSPPPSGTSFAGDVGKSFCPFATGALMDAAGEKPGKKVSFPHNSRDTQVRTVYVDLGQVVVLDALAVRSGLEPWQCISRFEVAFSVNGTSFSESVEHKGAGCSPMPHEAGLNVRCDLPVKDRRARYLRLRFSIPAWNSLQIDDLDITAHTPAEVQPAAQFDMEAFERTMRRIIQSPAIDELGQWARDDWPGKVQTEAELVKLHKANQARYASVELDLKRYDRFGGDKSLGFQAKAGPRWRLEKIEGRWWFITPDGNPFLMNAVDGLHCWRPTTVEHPDQPDLRKVFARLPPKRQGRFAEAWYDERPSDGIWRFDFFLANRIRVYGEKNHREKFYDTVQRRLIAWGFNSLGKWSNLSHEDVFEQLGHPMPFVLHADASPDPESKVAKYGDLLDPWDPNYAKAVENAVKAIAEEYGKDPFFVGLCFYGESWWHEDVTKRVLKSTPALPAKKAFVEQLRSNCGEISAINKKCGTSWKSYDELLTVDLNPFADKLKEELSKFVVRTSQRFYGAWREAINKYDPGRLLLGSCFVLDWQVQPEWIQGSIEACDAMMLDWYGKDVSGLITQYVERFAVPARRPVLLGEIGFTTPQYGFKPGVNSCKDQDERGRWYRYVYENLFAHPNWVGCMYFHYPDQQIPGRDLDGGGEAWQFGLVDVCDMPYETFIQHAKTTNFRLSEIHSGKAKPVTKKELGLEEKR